MGLYPSEKLGGVSFDKTYPSCAYHTVNGVKEWFNPPLIAGVEYRLMERYMGKPVYAYLYVNSSTLTPNANGEVWINITNIISNVDEFVRLQARSISDVDGAHLLLPWGYGYNNSHEVDGNMRISLWRSSDGGSRALGLTTRQNIINLHAVIYYTKTTD